MSALLKDNVVYLAKKRPTHPDDVRNWHNRIVADKLMAAGIPVFACESVNKKARISAWEIRDTDVTDAIREEARKRREIQWGANALEPLIGSTTNPKQFDRMERRTRNFVVGIPCGLAGIFVVDSDVSKNGPALVKPWIEANEGLPDGVFVGSTRAGGDHYIFKADEVSPRSSEEGGMIDYGCDVRGSTGYIIAAGCIMADDRSYGTMADLDRFIRLWKAGLPKLPAYIGAQIDSKASKAPGANISETQVAILANELRSADPLEAEDIFDPVIGFDLDRIAAERPKFAALLKNPSGDRSRDRMAFLNGIKSAYSETSAADCLSAMIASQDICGEWVEDGTKTPGNFNYRAAARDFLRVSPGQPGFGTDGAEFGDTEPETLEQQADRVKKLDGVFDYIEDLRGRQQPQLEWCLKHVIARDTTSVATGMWGAGKTAVFSDIGLHIAHGIPWRGKRVVKGVVLYVALENSADVERRISAWCARMEGLGHDLKGGAFVLHRGPCPLYSPNGQPTQSERDLLALAAKASERYSLPMAMIVIDTLAQSISPGDDQKSADAGVYTGAMQRIQKATQGNVTALAHPTKKGEGVRGSGGFMGNVDTVIEISRDGKTGEGRLRASDKFRIGDPSKVDFGYRLQSQTIGLDEDNEEITVVLAIEPPAHADTGAGIVADELPHIAPPDRLEDRFAAIADVIRAAGDEGLAADERRGSAPVWITAGQIINGLYAKRKADQLPALGRQRVSEVIGKMVTTGNLERRGENSRAVYRLKAAK